MLRRLVVAAQRVRVFGVWEVFPRPRAVHARVHARAGSDASRVHELRHRACVLFAGHVRGRGRVAGRHSARAEPEVHAKSDFRG